MNRHNKTYLSLLLAVCLILTAFVFALPASANSEEFTVPEIIPAKEAAENGYAARIKSEEPDLYTFVFFREDGLRTMRIFGHPVKYVDKDGEIRDITLELEKHGDGYVTAENSVKTEFPKSLREGVKLTSDGVSVTMIPDDTTQNARLERDGRTVSYKADENTSYEYSLTYSGFKEDIVVKEYTEKTEYAFTLITDGLALREEYGTYFLEDRSGRTKANIGDVIIFDADGRAHEGGRLTAETVRPNEEYRLTIVLDEEYLLGASYPIRIDPTIEINYANNGAGAIEDVTINQNVTFSGTSGSLYVGRHPAGSLSRSLMRFPTLSMTGISGITSASVEIRDLMCQGDEDISIECHVYEKNSPAWSESGTTTWSGVGTSYVGAYLDAHTVSYGAGNATGDFNRYSFNVTSAAQAWANGTQSPSKGFVFKASASFEGQTGSSIKTWYKTFASYNRASYKPSFSMTYQPNNTGFNNAVTITQNSPVAVNLSAGSRAYFKFIPQTTGFYTFESSSCTTGDPYGWLYNCDQDLLMNVDDTNGSINFRITYHLVSGVTYYLVAGCYADAAGTYNVTVYPTSVSSYVNAVGLTAGNNYTVSIGNKYKFAVYRFVPTETNEYLFFSTNSASGDPTIRIYNSSLSNIGLNDDGAGNSDFRYSATLTENQAYYIVAGQYSTNTGSYVLNSYKYLQLDSANEFFYYIKNKGTGLCLDLDSTSNLEWVCQRLYNPLDKEGWGIGVVANEKYITIKSKYNSNYYIGISSASIGINNVKLFTTVSDTTKWKIFANSNNEVIFESKAASGKILYMPNNSSETKPQLQNIGSLSNNCKWKLAYCDALISCRLTNRTFNIQCVGPDANGNDWYPFIESSVNSWNNSGAGTNIQLTDEATVSITIINDPNISWKGLTNFPDNTYYLGNYGTISINASRIINEGVAKRSTITHEIGHLLGLADIEKTDLFMPYYNDSLMHHYRDRQIIYVPQSFDITNVKFIYD